VEIPAEAYAMNAPFIFCIISLTDKWGGEDTNRCTWLLYVKFMAHADLANNLTHSQFYLTSQNMIAVFGNPNQMVLKVINRM
jgi:hypothetical protein